MKTQKKFPASALCLFPDQTAKVSFSGEGEDRKPRLDMTIYSGGVIQDHWYWGNLVLDLKGVSFPKKKFPILENHDTSKKIAFHDGPMVVEKGLSVDPERTEFVSTPESEEFQRLSGEGFPYEASARVVPRVIERIEKGAFAEANGIKVTGPGTIFRKWDFVEGSVCVFGYDRNTRAGAFSNEMLEIDCEISGKTDFQLNNKKEGIVSMDMETLLKEHPDLVRQIQTDAVNAAKSDSESAFGQKFQELSGKLETLSQTVESQKQTITDLSAKNLEYEKQSALRKVAEFKAKADSIWATKLEKGKIPAWMRDKVKKHVDHAAFINEETGECDWTQFSAKVDAEIKDWETQLQNSEHSVQGTAYQFRKPEDEFNEEDDAGEDAFVNEMLGLAGEKAGNQEGGK